MGHNLAASGDRDRFSRRDPIEELRKLILRFEAPISRMCLSS
jgi:hypothetical protein